MRLLILFALASWGYSDLATAEEKDSSGRIEIEKGFNPSVAPDEPFKAQPGGVPLAEDSIRKLPAPFNDPNRVWTLPELIDQALQRNPSTVSAWQQANAQAAQLGIAKAANYPTINIGASGGPEHSTSPTNPGYQTTNQIEATPQLQIQYTLLDFGVRRANQEEARLNLLSQNYNFNQTLQNVILTTMTNYYTLDQAKASVKNTETALELAQQTLQSVQVRNSVGLSTSTDLSSAEQSVAQARYNLENAHGSLGLAQVNLATSIGLPANAEFSVASPSAMPPLNLLQQNVDQLVNQGFRHRPDLAAKYNSWRAQLAAVDQAEANRWPALQSNVGLQRTYYETNTRGGFGPSGSFNGGGHYDDAAATLSFSFDLFDGGLKSYQIQSAQALAKAAQADLLTAELGTVSNVVTSYISFRTAARQVDAGQALLDSSTKSFEATKVAYANGLKTIIDEVTAENNLASARSTLSQARTNLYTAAANLANATGALLPSPANLSAEPVNSLSSNKK